MPFLSGHYAPWAKLSYLAWDGGILCLLSWKVMRYSDLEEDHINPTDFSKEMNKIYPFEVALHLGLIAWLMVHWETSLVLLNVPYLLWSVKMLLDKSYQCDASRVYSKDFKQWARSKMMNALFFFGFMECVYLVSMVWEVSHHEPPRIHIHAPHHPLPDTQATYRGKEGGFNHP